MKKSVIAFSAPLLLGFIGMGALGACLYYPAASVLGLFLTISRIGKKAKARW